MKRGLLCLVVLATSACSTAAVHPPASTTTTPGSTAPALIGEITGTDATCTQFANGSATTLNHLHFRTRGSAINVVLPQSFSYWVKVSSPGRTKSFVVNQSATSGDLLLATGGAAYTNTGATACT